MDLASYMREIEALVQHLSPCAGLLGDMDVHVIEELWEADVPLEAVLGGVRHGARRLSGLKRPPRGLPLKRVRPDVDRQARKRKKAAMAPPIAPAAPAEEGPWRQVVVQIAAEAPPPVARQLDRLSSDADLGEERAFVRFLAISRDYYQHRLETLPPGARDELLDDVARVAGPVLARMSPDGRQETVEELARRRLVEADPVLEPRRFWQD